MTDKVMATEQNHIAKIYKELQRTQFCPLEDIVTKQFKRLSRILSHCATHSPWYSARLMRSGWSKYAVHDPLDLCALPILTKANIQEAGSRLFCTRYPEWHGYRRKVRTSGSTGMPTEIWRTEKNDKEWMALALREHSWNRRDFTSPFCAIRIHGERSILVSNWAAPVRFFHESGPLLLLPLSWRVERLASEIECFRPAYIQIFPSILAGLMKHLQKNSRRWDFIKGIALFGEVVSPDLELSAKHFFDAPITKTYSSEEVGSIAFKCPSSDCYHVNAEFFLVEIVDERGEPSRPGAIGRVLVSDLSNFATPLVRYDIGDYAEAVDSCCCGRGLPAIKRIVGRSRNLMTLPNGTSCWPRLGYVFRSFSSTLRVKQYQVFQVKSDELLIRMVADHKPNERHKQVLAALISESVGYTFKVQFEHFEKELPRENNSKFEDFKNLIT